MGSGTRLRHLNASNLSELENMIGSLPDKVEIKTINYAPLNSGGANQWIAHFTLHDGQMSVEIASLEPELVKKLNKKRGK